jgi:hypothetical protein
MTLVLRLLVQSDQLTIDSAVRACYWLGRNSRFTIGLTGPPVGPTRHLLPFWEYTLPPEG